MHTVIIYGDFNFYDMKKLYLILILSIFFLTSCCGQHTAADLKKTAVQRELLKEYFLCVCITEGFKDSCVL